ncbi:MAG: helix-hairpin-helix domain-containing protein [Candidatus Omnitrophica bacterium]|nr:helix-hairpin-helix domain-containing protein [Candidatus Omnitrophota bacterium]
MFILTKNETIVLAVFAVVICLGSIFHMLIKKAPVLTHFTNQSGTGLVHHKIDINTADKVELESVPYIGDYTASAILEYRLKNGAFKNLEQLKMIRGIRENNFKRFQPYLKVGGP